MERVKILGTLLGSLIGALAALSPGAVGDKFRGWSLLLVESATSTVARVLEAADRTFDTGEAVAIATPLILAVVPGMVTLLFLAVAQASRWVGRVVAAFLFVLALVSFAVLELPAAIAVAVPCTLIAGVSLVLGGPVVQVAATSLGVCVLLSTAVQAVSTPYLQTLASSLTQATRFLEPYPSLAIALVQGFALLPFIVALAVLVKGALPRRGALPAAP